MTTLTFNIFEVCNHQHKSKVDTNRANFMILFVPGQRVDLFLHNKLQFDQCSNAYFLKI